MAKKKNSRDDFEERAMREGKKSIKKAAKKTHPATKFAVVVCLLVGLAVGVIFSRSTFKNDHFVLKGQAQYSIEAGSAFTYTEEGVDAVCFGRDVSDKLHVETDLQKDAAGNYIIPTDKEGVYTITYTVDAFKFGEKAPNGQIKRIRVFSVDAAEDDGRGDMNGEVAN